MKTREFLNTGLRCVYKNKELAFRAFTQGIEANDSEDQDAVAHCYFYRANIHFLRKNYHQALNDLVEFKKFCQPKDLGEWLRMVGNNHFYLGNYDLAIENYRAAIEAYPFKPSIHSKPYLLAECYKQMGRSYQHKGELTLAIENYSTAIELYKKTNSIPEDVYPGDAYFHLGSAYELQGDKEKALENYNLAFTDLKSMHDFDPYQRGKVFLSLKQYTHAQDDFVAAARKASQANNISKKAQCQYYIGLTYQRRGDNLIYDELFHFEYKQAKRYFRKTIAKCSNTHSTLKAQAYQGLGEIHAKQKRYKKALKEFDEALKLFKNPEQKGLCYFSRLKVYYEQKKYLSAWEECDKAIQLYSTMPDADPADVAAAYFWRGEILSAMPKQYHQNAAFSFSKSAELYPHDHPKKKNSKYYYAITLQTLNEHEKAISELSNDVISQFEPKDQAQIYFKRALSYAELKQYAEAKDDFNRALYIDSDSSYFIAKQFDEKQLRWIIKNYPEFCRDTIKPALQNNKEKLQFVEGVEKKIENENKSGLGRKIFGFVGNTAVAQHERIKAKIASDVLGESSVHSCRM